MSDYERFKDTALRMVHSRAGDVATAYAALALAEKLDELIQVMKEARE